MGMNFSTGSHAFLAQRPVRREAGDGEPEAEGAGLRGRNDKLRRLDDDRPVPRVAALDRGQRPRAAVLLADHALDLQRTVQLDPRVAQRPRRRQRAAQLPLHVHDPAPEQAPVALGEFEGRGPPALDLAGGDDIDMPVQDQRPAVTASHGPDHAESLATLHVGRVGRVPAQPLEIDLPHIRLETDGTHLLRHPLLGRRLAVRDALDRDEVGQHRDQPFRVHRLHGAALVRRQRAAVRGRLCAPGVLRRAAASLRRVPAGTSRGSLVPIARHRLPPTCCGSRSMPPTRHSGRPGPGGLVRAFRNGYRTGWSGTQLKRTHGV